MAGRKKKAGVSLTNSTPVRITNDSKEILDYLKKQWNLSSIDEVLKRLIIESDEAKAALLKPKLAENPLVGKILKEKD